MTSATELREPAQGRASGLRPGVPVQLRGLSWEDYTAVTDLIGDRRLRTFYCDGEAEILMPSTEHEGWIGLLGRLLDVLTEELRIACRCAGMTTFRREDLERGLEPDRCYYLTNEAKIRGKKRLDMSIDPPPDLALEVEITSSVEKRMRVYAGLGVPEVWRFDGEKLTVNQLVANGEYVIVERSRFFPSLPLLELVRFGQEHEQIDDTSLAIAFREWVKQQIATGWPVSAKA